MFIILFHWFWLLSLYVDAQHEFKTEFYDQYIDHFNFYNYENRTFKQRYIYNDENFNPENGTLLFYTGNEGDITSFWDNTGFIFDVAYLFRGLVVFTEHRFYGKSLPFNDTKSNFMQPQLSLLSIDQALADFAYVIQHISLKFKLKPNTPVITFGGSYGGILSAYMRMKYPQLVSGAIASSAPLLGVANLVPRNYFFKYITKVFHETRVGCVDVVRDGFAKIEELLCTTDEDNNKSVDMRRHVLMEELKLCTDLVCSRDRTQLFTWMRNAFTVLAMSNYPYQTDFLVNLPGHPVQVSCDRLLSKDYNIIKGLYRVMDMVYNSSQDGNKTCFNIYEEYMICADPTGCGQGNDGIAWDYQSCADMVLPDGTDNLTDMFPVLPFTLRQREQYCRKTYNVIPRNERLGLLHGDDPEKWPENGISNIVFTNGDLDPWMPGGILKNLSKSLVSYVIHGGAHHLDLRASNIIDPESVKWVREAELYHISTWINNNQTTLYSQSTATDRTLKLWQTSHFATDILDNSVGKENIF